MRTLLCFIAVWATERGPTDLPHHEAMAIAATPLPNMSVLMDGMNRYLDRRISEQYMRCHRSSIMIPMAILHMTPDDLDLATKANEIQKYGIKHGADWEGIMSSFLTDNIGKSTNTTPGAATSAPMDFVGVAAQMEFLATKSMKLGRGAITGMKIMPGTIHPFTAIPDEYEPEEIVAKGLPAGMTKEDWMKTLVARRVTAVSQRMNHDVLAQATEVAEAIAAARKFSPVVKWPGAMTQHFAFGQAEQGLQRLAETGAFVMRKFTPERTMNGVKFDKMMFALPMGVKDTFRMQKIALIKVLKTTLDDLNMLWQFTFKPALKAAKEDGQDLSKVIPSQEEATDAFDVAFSNVMASLERYSVASEMTLDVLGHGYMPPDTTLLMAYGNFSDSIAETLDVVRKNFMVDSNPDSTKRNNHQVTQKVEQFLKERQTFLEKNEAGESKESLEAACPHCKMFADHSTSYVDSLNKKYSAMFATDGSGPSAAEKRAMF